MENQGHSGKEQEIKSFYNTYKRKQEVTGINLRHYMVFDRCIKAGLKRDHHVLEIGCGIGTFTRLIARYITKGTITATDISNESIDEAQKNKLLSDRVNFIVSDMTDFVSDKKFDFVVMVDVLEHIPFEQYDQLFRLIDQLTHMDSILAMNIPHPDMIRHIRANHPEMLQIVDNPVEMDYLSANIYKNHFRLSGYKPYSINNTGDDYIFMTFEKQSRQKAFRQISTIRIIMQKLMYRINFLRLLIFSR
jgi:cyclopropane fatty-acyl-phospholipid synthase-like methyltransferase